MNGSAPYEMRVHTSSQVDQLLAAGSLAKSWAQIIYQKSSSPSAPVPVPATASVSLAAATTSASI